MTSTTFRWGILGTAQIARKNWKAIKNTGNSTITAVASRNLERCRQFIADCQAEAPLPIVPQALGSYEALIASKEIDAVYIPLPTGIRKEWVIRAAEAGKHIVCEKPCAVNAADLKEMIAACERHRVQFMDGVMFMHSRRLDRIRAILNGEQTIGTIRRITSAFTFAADHKFLDQNIRTDSQLEPHGCLGDLGWYCIRFALWLMDWKLPEKVAGRVLGEMVSSKSNQSVPIGFSGELFFEGGISSSFYCSFAAGDQQWAHVSGTEGSLYIPDFVLPHFGSQVIFNVQKARFNVEGCDFNMESHAQTIAVEEYSNSHPTAQETNLFRNFANQVLSGRLNPLWPAMALKTQQVMQDCLDAAQNPLGCLEA